MFLNIEKVLRRCIKARTYEQLQTRETQKRIEHIMNDALIRNGIPAKASVISIQ